MIKDISLDRTLLTPSL